MDLNNQIESTAFRNEPIGVRSAYNNNHVRLNFFENHPLYGTLYIVGKICKQWPKSTILFATDQEFKEFRTLKLKIIYK